MKTFLIKENDSNQRLDKFLSKAVPKLHKNLLYKYLRLKRIKVNGKKAEIDYRLQLNDMLELYVNDEYFNDESDTIKENEFLKAPADITVIYEDDNIMLLNKPTGLCVHEDNDHTVDTLINRCLHYLFNRGEYRPQDELSFTPSLCNRIDRNTSGIVIFAKNAESLRILNEKIKNREVKKFYLCVVSGIISEKSATLKNFLLRNENESTVKVLAKPTPLSKTIITTYTVLDQTNQNSLLEVELQTGRTHQIRAHMQYINHPIIGDGKYGINSINRKYKQTHQLLCAYKLRFEFTDNEKNSLSYLNHREWKIESVWFKDKFQETF